jgi:Domain of unknown function DUF29
MWGRAPVGTMIVLQNSIEGGFASMSRNAIPASIGQGHLYERDYYTWALEQARALREQRPEALDWKNLAEEVEDLGRSERRELQSRLEVLLTHLLKWQLQPKRRTRSWNATMAIQRVKIRQLLDENPALKLSIPDVLARAYEPARIEVLSRLKTAAQPPAPNSCPWTFEQVIDDRFKPAPKV